MRRLFIIRKDLNLHPGKLAAINYPRAKDP